MPQPFRCPTCRTRRASFTSLLKHCADHDHKVCGCGGYPYPHREGSRYCEKNPSADIHIAVRNGVEGDALEEVVMYVAFDKPGKPLKVWPYDSHR